MARWRLGSRYEKRAKKALTLEQRLVAKRYLERLAKDPVPGNLVFKPMEGHNGLLWECRAGGQNRFILRKTKDENGTLFVVEDVGPHDIYGDY